MAKELSDRQRLLAQALARGLTDAEACKEAGYKARSPQAAGNQVARMMKNDEFIAYRKELADKTEEEGIKTAPEVARDLSELMDFAKGERDYQGFVALANRLAKMRAHDEPEKHKLEFEVTIGGDGEDSEG